MIKTFASIIFVLTSSTYVFAADCPVKDFDENYSTNVVTAIEKATSCYQAADIAESCAVGSSMDVFITQPAFERCSRDFMKNLSKNKTDLAAYQKLHKRCSDKYAKMQGTMYRSASAFCSLAIDRVYSSVYTPAESGE